MEKLIDAGGAVVPGPDGTVVGRRISGPLRMVWALPLSGSGLSRRFSSFAPGEDALFGMDFSFVLPFGAAIMSASLLVFTNTFSPAPAPEWAVGPVTIEGAVVYARLSGGVVGRDYQLRFTATDSDGNVWPRTALVLCSLTS